MTLNRRGFLRAVPAAPIAARQAAQAAAASSAIAPQSVGYGSAYGIASVGPDPYDVMQGKIVGWVQSGNLPEWKARQFRHEARYRSRWLDADIIAMRSLSDAAKYRRQEEREYQRVIQEHIENHEGNSIWRSWITKIRGEIG